jgi:EmrB/QacA subfamily drug resistance transporter
MSATTASTDRSGELSHRQIMTILSGLMLGMFLASLDQMIVSTAIRTIGDHLNGLSIQAWVTTGFLITSTISTPLYGKLSDMYGRKPLYLFAIATFIVGSALCGLSTSMYMLAAFRALQGIGAGGLVSLALAIMGDVIPPRERARYQGYFMAVFATSSVLGPVVGGFFAGQAHIFGVSGWRWIFYINVPIAVLALVVVSRVLRIDHERRSHRVDWAGSLALVVGLVPLLVVAEQGREWGWTSGGALACYLIGLLGLVAFVRVEAALGDEALIPMRLFRNDIFRVGSTQSFLIGIGMFGAIGSIPLYLQIVKGASPTKAGLLILPMVLGMMTASLTAGQIISRTGKVRIFPIIGTSLAAIGLGLLTQVGADTPLWHTDLLMLCVGAGVGLCMQTLVLAMQNAVPPQDMGVSTAAATFFRQVGGTLGTAVFLSILFSTAGTSIRTNYASAQHTAAFQAAARAHPDAAAALQAGLSRAGGLNDTSFLMHLPKVMSHPFLAGFSHGMDLSFMVGAVVMALGALVSLLLREVPLRAQSGLQAQRAAHDAAEGVAVLAVEPEAITPAPR